MSENSVPRRRDAMAARLAAPGGTGLLGSAGVPDPSAASMPHSVATGGGAAPRCDTGRRHGIGPEGTLASLLAVRATGGRGAAAVGRGENRP